MSPRILLSLSLSLLLISGAFPAPSDEEVEARSRALTLAGAFSNDGFKIRDGHWVGTIKKGESKIIQVNLYAGNEYWFSVAATDQAKKLVVNVFDETGQPLKSEPYQEGFTAAAGFSPDASGPYFIKVEQLEGEPAAFCLLYSYK